MDYILASGLVDFLYRTKARCDNGVILYCAHHSFPAKAKLGPRRRQYYGTLFY